MINEASSRTTTYFTHKDFRVTEIIDTEGKSTTYEYNEYGELMTTTDRNGNTITYERDTKGNVTKITNPDTSYKRFGYDSKDNLIWELDEEGNFVRYVYDSSGIILLKVAKYIAGEVNIGLLESELPVLTGNEVNYAITEYMPYTSADLTACKYGYTIKLKGVVHKIKDPLGNITTYYHYEDGNVWKVKEPLESYDTIARTTTYTYNSMGLKEDVFSQENKKTHYEYNNNGQVTTVEKSDENGESTTVINYNELGFVEQTLYPKHISEILPEALAQQGYRYTYYPSGKVETVTDPEDNTTEYYYDQYGNLKSEVRPNGSVYSYDYDFLNRVTKKYFQEFENSPKILLEEYIYATEDSKDADLNHYKTKVTIKQYFNANDTAETLNSYDYAGRLIKQELPYDGTGNRPYIQINHSKMENLNGLRMPEGIQRIII